MDILSLLRPVIKQLISEQKVAVHFDTKASIFLDANESPYDLEFTRYPDPFQTKVKARISKWKGIDASKIFLGNGTIEIIDLLLRAFCVPGQDSILTLNPYNEKYQRCTKINEIKLDTLTLDEHFSFKHSDILARVGEQTKMIFFSSPNEISGMSIPLVDIKKICSQFKGIVVVDESYIDFSESESVLSFMNCYQNIVVVQSFSHGLAAAGLRLGIGFANEILINILNTIKPHYNINQLSQEAATMRMAELEDVQLLVKEIKINREILSSEISKLSFVKKVYPSNANFLLIRVDHADLLFSYLRKNGIVVKNQSHLPACDNCLSITVGNPQENQDLLNCLLQFE